MVSICCNKNSDENNFETLKFFFYINFNLMIQFLFFKI